MHVHFVAKSLRYAVYAHKISREKQMVREKEELVCFCVSNDIGEPQIYSGRLTVGELG